jgi:hypothetical protein
MRRLLPFVLAAVLPLARPLALPAQQASPWNAFYGCWISTDAAGLAPLSCYLPVEGAPRQVVQALVLNGRVVTEATITADGVAHKHPDAACTGESTATPSATAARIYTRDVSGCGAVVQATEGLLAISPRQELLRLYLVGGGDQRALITERLFRASTERLPDALRLRLSAVEARATSALRAAAQPLDVAAIEDVAASADVALAEAWMVETTREVEGFTVRRRDLERLVAAGVDTRIVDMAVVVAHPDEFVTELDVRGRSGAASGLSGWGDTSCFQRLTNNWGPFALGYWPAFAVGPVSLFGASDCIVAGYLRGVPFWAYQQGFWRSGMTDLWRYGYLDPALLPTRVVVRPVQPGDDFGRVQKGSGYTPRGTSDGTASPRGAPTSITPRGGSTASSSEGGGRTPTASGSGTGRVAQPRDPKP